MCNLELENVYDKKTEVAKIRSKCEWYQHGEKPKKFFLNLEKEKAINTTVRRLTDEVKDITDLKEVNASICNFYKNLFKKSVSLFDLTRQNAFLIFLNVDSKLLLLQNHLLLIFKIYIYISRRSESLILKSLIREITKVKNIEEEVSINN